MAYQQQFHSRLLQQLNDTNGKNLELQSLLAQKDDENTTLDARLKNALATSGGESTCSGSCVHQRRNAELIASRNNVESVAAAAEANLKTTTKRFTILEADLKKQIAHLQHDVRKRDELLREVAETCRPEPTGRGSEYGAPGPSNSSAELKKTKAELKRLRTAFSSLQKQFEAEKRESARLQSFPAAATEKLIHIEEADQDDEEVIPNLKHERPLITETPLSGPPALSTVSDATHFARPTAPVPRSTVKRRVQSTPVVEPRSTAPESLFSTIRSSQSRRQSATSQKRLSTVSTPKSSIPQKRKTPPNQSPDPKGSKCRIVEDTETSGPEDLDGIGDALSSALEEIKPQRPVRHSGIDIKHLQDRFEFIAVTKQDEDGTIESFHSRRDLKGECDELWDHIRRMYDLWVEAWGEDWAREFEKRGYDPAVPQCVTTRLEKGGTTRWRAGCEGKYACWECVEKNQPCFTWNGEEYWLLPLHEKDRKWPVEQDNEIRWWLNLE